MRVGALLTWYASCDMMQARPEMGADIGVFKKTDKPLTIQPWSSLPPHEKHGVKPPYKPPADRIYNTKAGPVEGKINVHIVPHSHDDTGWQVTVDQYFFNEVYYVVDTVVERLRDDPNRRFMFVEIAFFARWWDEQPDWKRNVTRTLVEEGRLEFINGGWCMHDEASPHYVEMVDQTTRGHQFLLKNFGEHAIPRGTWQIDPFGHSSTNAWLLSAEAGMQSLFWGRTDFQDFNVRKEQKRLEWIWQGSQSMGSSSRVFAGELYGTGGGGYGSWFDFDGSNNQVQDNPERHDYNVDQYVDQFIQHAMAQAADTQADHQLWASGEDFNYQNAEHWYHNLDKLIHYVNLNGTVNAFYSTPTVYTEQKYKANEEWEVRQDDIFPLADAAHNYWTGYFTSRPTLKRQVRAASNFLNAARQLEVLSGVTKKDVDAPTTRPSPVVGDSWTDSLEGTIGVATHHDGMSGTERQDVSNDYAQRISESHNEVEVGVALSLKKLAGIDADLKHCNCNTAGNCLNMSVCAFTVSQEEFSVAAWNPLGQKTVSVARLPVVGSSWGVTGPDGQAVASQVIAIDNRTYELPLLYINYYNLSDKEVEEQKAALANKATHILTFPMEVGNMGYGIFTAKKGSGAQVAQERPVGTDPVVVSNGVYELTFDPETAQLKSMKNVKSGVAVDIGIQWGWYNSSVGGCTSEISPYEYSCSNQASGAYMFRPNTSELMYPGPPGKPTLKVVEGDLVTEVYQGFSSWVTHVIRLVKNQPYVEVEYTVGPIPIDTPWVKVPADVTTNWGKEVIIRYDTNISSKGTFYADSNGREMVKRQLNARGPSYPPLNVSEPVAGNYYPVNAMLSLDDGEVELAVLTDVTQGGSSLKDGSLELMVHRRIQVDDSRGVQEPLNETMCGCNDINADPGQMGEHGHEGDGGCVCAGLTIRGRHWLVLDTVEAAHDQRRVLSEAQNFPPTLAFTAGAAKATSPEASFLAADLPKNLKLQTLTSNYASFNDGQLLLRFSHLYSVNEHPTLSQPVQVDLSKMFGSGYRVAKAKEMSLTANQDKATMEAAKYDWKVKDVTGGLVEEQLASCNSVEEHTPMDGTVITLRPMEVKTYLITFEHSEGSVLV
mmetsp:Transcript_90839/g.207946  ORF Transcript_90839/g.207946 Transcript_90839/m.207946 type:complete len:1109 (+) Transcript_90839:54-3380(+)